MHRNTILGGGGGGGKRGKPFFLSLFFPQHISQAQAAPHPFLISNWVWTKEKPQNVLSKAELSEISRCLFGRATPIEAALN